MKRYEQIVANLESVVGEKENKINILAQKCQTLSLRIAAENSKQTAPLVAENNKLLKTIEDRDARINELKMQLESQEQFINALNCQDTESDEENGTPNSHGIPVFKWSGGRLGRICSVGNGV